MLSVNSSIISAMASNDATKPWYMARRLRSALIEKNMDKLGGIVEVDEAFIRG